MVIGRVGRDRSCCRIAFLIRREWFPRLKIQQKRKWKLCDFKSLRLAWLAKEQYLTSWDRNHLKAKGNQ